jgi:hypothetical protein
MTTSTLLWYLTICANAEVREEAYHNINCNKEVTESDDYRHLQA